MPHTSISYVKVDAGKEKDPVEHEYHNERGRAVATGDIHLIGAKLEKICTDKYAAVI